MFKRKISILLTLVLIVGSFQSVFATSNKNEIGFVNENLLENEDTRDSNSDDYTSNDLNSLNQKTNSDEKNAVGIVDENLLIDQENRGLNSDDFTFNHSIDSNKDTSNSEKNEQSFKNEIAIASDEEDTLSDVSEQSNDSVIGAQNILPYSILEYENVLKYQTDTNEVSIPDTFKFSVSNLTKENALYNNGPITDAPLHTGTFNPKNLFIKPGDVLSFNNVDKLYADGPSGDVDMDLSFTQYGFTPIKGISVDLINGPNFSSLAYLADYFQEQSAVQVNMKFNKKVSGYITMSDFDYGEYVILKKSNIYKIIVRDDTKLRYEDLGEEIKIMGKPYPDRVENTPDYQLSFIFRETDHLQYVAHNADGTFLNLGSNRTFSFLNQQSFVRVEYVDEDNNQLEPTDIISGSVGSPYETTPKVIEGYTFVRLAENSSSENGYFTDNTQVVTYVYTESKLALGKLYVNHLDVEGNELVERELSTQEVGTAYVAQQQNIEGYQVKEIIGDVEGVYKEEDISVTFIYEKLKDSEPQDPEEDTPVENETSKPRVDDKKTPKTAVVSNENNLFIILILASITILILKRNIFKKSKSNY